MSSLLGLDLLRRVMPLFGRAEGISQPIKRRLPGPLDERPKWGAGVIYFNQPIDSGAGVAWNPGMPASTVFWITPQSQYITLNGSNVSSWADRTGNGNTFSQGTAAKQPAYHSSGGGNNSPYVQFTGAGATLLTCAGTTQVLEFDLVFRPVWSGTASLMILGISIGAPVDSSAANQNSSTIVYQVEDAETTLSQQTYTQGSDVMMAFVEQATGNIQLFKDTSGNTGSQDGTGTNQTPYKIGDLNVNNTCGNFFLYEMSGYSSPLNSTQRSNNLSYYRTTYGNGV